MQKVRVGIIGMGNIGKYHADYLLQGKVDRCELVAVCSTSPNKLESYQEKGLKIFGDANELIRSKTIDAVIIATPHYQHTSLGIAAFEAGLHVMSEKPISAHKADAERLIAVAKKHSNQIFGAMFQLRVEPRYMEIRKLIQSGQLGQIVRTNWIITDWFRSEAYYQSGGWRATWRGEGGGVLLNQCLHNLDVLAWLLGMPARVRSFAQLGRFHEIEVEDNVTAYFEYPNRATGVFITSTGEAPGTNRFEIAGSRGKVVLEKDKLVFTENKVDAQEYIKTSKIGFQKPDAETREIPIENAVLPHAILMQNFVNAILDGEKLIAPGDEGIWSVELANVMLYSSLADEIIEMPMSGAAFETKLTDLISESKTQKTVREVSTEDFVKSFNR
jgi:predicted dehydrogenase